MAMSKDEAQRLARLFAHALDKDVDLSSELFSEMRRNAADHPAVQRAQWAIAAAERAAVASVARDLEGLIASRSSAAKPPALSRGWSRCWGRCP